MPWSKTRIVRELHFLSSLAVVLVLVFFALTGFMAQHREWFHPRVDRHHIAEPRPLASPCAGPVLQDVCGGAAAWAEGAFWLAEGDGQACACRRGEEVWYLGTSVPRPAGERFDRAWEQATGEHVEAREEPGFFHADDLWRLTVLRVGPEQVLRWDRRLPLAYSLIEVHRGRGSTDLIVDVASVLVLFVAGTGVLHGLRITRRRRYWALLLAVSAALVVGLLLG